jgi:hypothetical protein
LLREEVQMPEATLGAVVRAEQSLVIDAAPDRVWSLLGSAAAWSLAPGSGFAFDIVDSPAGIGHLLFAMANGRHDRPGGIYEVRELTPGEMISVAARSWPARQQVFTLSVEHRRRGTKASAAVSSIGQPEEARSKGVTWQKLLAIWLTALKSVIEGRAQLPADPPVPPSPYAGGRQLRDPIVVSATEHIAASVSAVWQAVRSHEVTRVVTGAAYCGRVPGTPGETVGAMRYSVRPRPGGLLVPVVTIVAELAPESSVLVRRVARPHDETLCRLASDGTGTRLEVTSRWLAPEAGPEYERVSATLAEQLSARARGYKAFVENAASPA